MEFVEEESRPRFLLHSRSPASAAIAPDASGSPAVSKPHAAACVAASVILLISVFYFQIQSPVLATLLIWAAVSLLVGPFAPPFITGGDVRVGVGELLEPQEPDPSPEDEVVDLRKRNPGRRLKARRSEEPPPLWGSVPPLEKTEVTEQRNGASSTSGGVEKGEVEESEWNEEDFEILKKQVAKHPVGTPKRWERIAEAFGGRHGVDSVIKTAKSLHEKRPGAGDSFAQFLRQRKPIDKRADVVDPELAPPAPSENGQGKVIDANGVGDGSWSSREDIALLNALKAFPKDTSMRWEKIAAAVPGRSKAACMRRVTELKNDFRSTKASEA